MLLLTRLIILVILIGSASIILLFLIELLDISFEKGDRDSILRF